MRNRLMMAVLWLGVVALAGGVALSHCEVPCGIYDDKARVQSIREHLQTVEKAMMEMQKLTGADANPNQQVRWITNKETHATEIQHICSQYFMTQRLKPAAEGDAAAQAKYVRELTLVHQIMIAAMKCKQTTDVQHVKKARALLDRFEASYFGEAKADGPHDHGPAGHTHATGDEHLHPDA